MARKRTRSQAEEEESEQNSRRDIREAETSTNHQNMNEEEAEAETSIRINIDKELRGPGGEVLVKLNKGVNAPLFRLNPERIANVMEFLNVKQQGDVIELGFGALLNFKMNYIPPKLGFWLAAYFNPIACGLPIGGPRTNCKHIDEVDVHLTLGLPKGRHPIERKTKTDDVSWMQAIAKSLKKPRKNINIEDIAILMLEEVNGGDQFKRLLRTNRPKSKSECSRAEMEYKR